MRVKIFCAVVSLLAALSQRDLPYHADKEKVHSHVFEQIPRSQNYLEFWNEEKNTLKFQDCLKSWGKNKTATVYWCSFISFVEKPIFIRVSDILVSFVIYFFRF